jgi:hypothetical protein
MAYQFAVFPCHRLHMVLIVAIIEYKQNSTRIITPATQLTVISCSAKREVSWVCVGHVCSIQNFRSSHVQRLDVISLV